MKNSIKLIAIVAIITTLGLSVTACPSGGTQTQQAKAQSATIDNLFGGSYSATVKGNMTDAQWAGVANKIKTALNDGYTAQTLPSRMAWFTKVFGSMRGGAIIIVEITTAYANWKTTTDGVTLYLNLTCVNGSDLQAKLTIAVEKANNSAPDSN